MAIPLDIEEILGGGCFDAVKRVASIFSALFMGFVMGVYAPVMSGVAKLIFLGSFSDALKLFLNGLSLGGVMFFSHFFSLYTLAMVVLFGMGAFSFVKSEGATVVTWLIYVACFALVICLMMRGSFSDWWWLDLVFLVMGMAMLCGGGVFFEAWRKNRIAQHFAAVKAESIEREQKFKELRDRQR